MIGISNILWYIGPIVTLVLALAFSSLGVLGIRLLFVHLFIVAAVTWYLRRGIIESPRYEELAANEQQQSGDGGAVSAHHHRGLRRLLGEAKHRRALLFVFGVFCLWNIPAGTYGFFLPYIIKNAGQTSQAASVAIQMLWFVTAIIALGLVFMRVNDRTNRALLYGVTAAIQAVGFWIFVFAAPNLIGWAILNVILFGFGQGAGQWPLNRLWSVELFPTSVRNTAQGIIFGLMRLVLGVWSFFVPTLLGCQTGAGNSLTRCTTSGFHTMFLILSLMLTFTAVVGWIWGPRTEGMSLERIERAREQGELSI